VIRGRQIAWIAGGTLYVLALEAPEQAWAADGDRYDRLAAADAG
jgi:hypothetical protein